jgi:hypothetical protein
MGEDQGGLSVGTVRVEHQGSMQQPVSGQAVVRKLVLVRGQATTPLFVTSQWPDPFASHKSVARPRRSRQSEARPHRSSQSEARPHRRSDFIGTAKDG